MKAASINEIKKELNTLEFNKVFELCMRLAKYKKENKELLSYLLFDAIDEPAYIENVKKDIDQQFDEIQKHNMYHASKSLRKILRTTNKYIKYAGQLQTETELLIYFLMKLKKSGIRYRTSTVLTNMYERQFNKIKTAIGKLHEDLQFDYQQELENLENL
jgi:gas vesicle protein